MMTRIWAVGVVLLTGGLAASGAQALEPPDRCEIKRGAWCILRDDVTVTKRLPTPGSGEVIWSVRDPLWKSDFVIVESRGCDQVLSKDPKITGYVENASWGGDTWNEVNIKLDIGGVCSLRLLSKSGPADIHRSDYVSKLGLLRMCVDKNCGGETILKRFGLGPLSSD